MYDPRIPDFEIPSIGYIRASRKKIDVSIRASLRHLRRNKKQSNKNWEFYRYRLVEKLKWLWGIRRRVLDRDNLIPTWKPWRGKDVKDKYQGLFDNWIKIKKEDWNEAKGEE